MFLRPAGFFLLLASFAGQGFAQTTPDSITVAVEPSYDKVSGLHRVLFGEAYRKLWAAPVRLRVLHLGVEKGGLTITEKGGGLQTKSVRLKDTSGKEWVLRSVQKYPERGLPPKLKATIVKDILQDQVVTSHPFAALTVPPFAEALGLLHTNPEIIFLPDDSLLGPYRADFANTALLFEERQPATVNGTDNTEKVIRKLQADNDVSIDQKTLLRARLLDLFLGDWDRHDDQWRWVENKEGEQTLYVPTPRDRDKVYYTTSGLFPRYLSYQSGKENLQPFKENVRAINKYNTNNRFFDRYFLNALSEADWKEQAVAVAALLTDSLIKAAVRILPDTIYKLSGDRIINVLMGRRTNLETMALRYFHDLSKFVDVEGTAKGELWEIEYKPVGVVAVSIYKLKKNGVQEQRLYHREFTPKHTKEIRLYGLGGTDVFIVSGSNKSPIKIHVAGGDGIDSFSVSPGVVNKHRLFVYDRSDEENFLPSSSQVRLKASADTTVNKYDRTNFRFESFTPLFAASYNPDQGVNLGVGAVLEKQAFRKDPYAQRNLFFASYATGWHSLNLAYAGEFKSLFWKNDLTLNVIARTPNNVSNFFGVGNETVFPNKEDRRLFYFRNRYNYTNGDVRIRRKLGNYWSINGGIGFQYYNSSAKKNSNHYLASYNVQQPSEDVFSSHFFGGFIAGTSFHTHTHGLLPAKGLNWNMQVTGMREVNGSNRSYGQVQSELSFYIPLADSAFILANRVGGGATAGHPLFFQQLYLGGIQNLRGYAFNRFAGNTSFYHSVELRIKLFDFAAYLFPGTVGLIGFRDTGRVWASHEASDKWHTGYGGGLYLIPADLLLLQAAVGHSVEGTQVYIAAGFSF